MKNEVWSVVLAGGAGRRLSTLTGGVPKQFWRPRGGLSLLNTTLARLAPFSDPAHTVVVVDRHHHPYVHGLSDRVGTLLYQPSDRGTAAGILMALMPVLALAPHAVVVLSPCDHGIRNVSQFHRSIRDMIQHVGNGGPVVLFGATPTYASTDYGWIVPESAHAAAALRRVRTFVEKPSRVEAERLFVHCAVWNTMVVVARAAALQALFAEHLSDLSHVFEAAMRLAPPDRATFLSSAYPEMRPRDFSRDLLTLAQDLEVYTWPVTLGWSDLGTPDRLSNWFGLSGRWPPDHSIGAA